MGKNLVPDRFRWVSEPERCGLAYRLYDRDEATRFSVCWCDDPYWHVWRLVGLEWVPAGERSALGGDRDPAPSAFRTEAAAKHCAIQLYIEEAHDDSGAA